MSYIPLLTGTAAKNLIKDFSRSQIQSYSRSERENTNVKIQTILNQRSKKIEQKNVLFF